MTGFIPAAVGGPTYRSPYAGTANSFVPALQQVRDVTNEIQLLDPNESPLVILLRKFRSKKMTAMKKEWYEDTYPAVITQVNDATGYTTENVITVDNGALFRARDLWMCSETGAIHWVVSVSTNDVTFVKDIGGDSPTEATTIDDNDTMFYIGNASETGAGSRAMLTTIAELKYNYAQIYREPVYIDNSLDTVQLYGGPDMKYQLKKAGVSHMRDKERGSWFGIKGRITSVDQASGITSAVHTQDGVFSYISSDYTATNASSSLTEDEFDGYVRAAARYGSGVKFMFCSPVAMSVINSWGRDKLQTVPRDKTYGININRFKNTHMELNLINTKMFGDMANQTSNSAGNVDYDLCSVILDLDKLWFLSKRGVTLNMNTQNNDVDGKRHEYLTECSLEMHNPEHHYLIENWVM